MNGSTIALSVIVVVALILFVAWLASRDNPTR